MVSNTAPWTVALVLLVTCGGCTTKQQAPVETTDPPPSTFVQSGDQNQTTIALAGGIKCAVTSSVVVCNGPQQFTAQRTGHAPLPTRLAVLGELPEGIQLEGRTVEDIQPGDIIENFPSAPSNLVVATAPAENFKLPVVDADGHAATLTGVFRGFRLPDGQPLEALPAARDTERGIYNWTVTESDGGAVVIAPIVGAGKKTGTQTLTITTPH